MVLVLTGEDNGRYPHGNSVLVEGRSEIVIIDPSLSIADGAVPLEHVDRVVISHAHEDHIAGLFRFPHSPVHVHSADLQGLQSLDGLMQIYGMPVETELRWRDEVVNRFHYAPRPDAQAFAGGDTFDIGGAVIHVLHLPGHTRGHCGFYIEPDEVMFLADVDLTGFGPYYGDAWSSIDDFERTLARCREIDARTYVTFHHKGNITGRAELLPLLDDYEAVIARRERAMLEFLREPRTLQQMVAHRFIYRPHVQLLFAEAVERRSAQLHLARLIARGMVTEAEPNLYTAC